MFLAFQRTFFRQSHFAAETSVTEKSCSLSGTKKAGRYSRHDTLKSFIKQTLGSLSLPSMLEPRGLYRTDGKRPEGVTMIPWEMGKQLVWDVTVVDALAPIRLT